MIDGRVLNGSRAVGFAWSAGFTRSGERCHHEWHYTDALP